MTGTRPEPLVDPMGDFFDQVGLPRNAGRLFGFLLTCEPPECSADRLAEAVGASSGSVSSMMRLLVGMGMVSRRGRPGSRQYLYRIRPEAWSDLLIGRLRLVGRLRELAEQGLDSIEGETSRSDRLEAMRDFYAFFETEMSAVIQRYRSRRS